MAEVQTMASQPQASETVLKLRRTFRVPRDRVYQAWANPGELQQWWGPKGYTCTDANGTRNPEGPIGIA